MIEQLNALKVSTHSRAEAAAGDKSKNPLNGAFQHTAARRRLPLC